MVFIGDKCIPSLNMLVIKRKGPNLIVKTCLKASKLVWPNVDMIKHISKDHLRRKFLDVFVEGNDTIKRLLVSMKLRNDVKLVFFKSLTVPFIFIKATDLQSKRLTEEWILKLVDFSERASSKNNCLNIKWYCSHMW